MINTLKIHNIRVFRRREKLEISRVTLFSKNTNFILFNGPWIIYNFGKDKFMLKFVWYFHIFYYVLSIESDLKDSEFSIFDFIKKIQKCAKYKLSSDIQILLHFMSK